jgi:hypothetical protein
MIGLTVAEATIAATAIDALNPDALDSFLAELPEDVRAAAGGVVARARAARLMTAGEAETVAETAATVQRVRDLHAASRKAAGLYVLMLQATGPAATDCGASVAGAARIRRCAEAALAEYDRLTPETAGVR